MKAEDFFQPLFGRARRAITPRQYRWGGAFLAAMAVGSLLLDGLSGWPGAFLFGLPAIGSFRLARRAELEPTPSADDGAA